MKSLVYKAATGSGRCHYSKKCQWLLKMQLFRKRSGHCFGKMSPFRKIAATGYGKYRCSERCDVSNSGICHCSEICHVIHFWKMSLFRTISFHWFGKMSLFRRMTFHWFGNISLVSKDITVQKDDTDWICRGFVVVVVFKSLVPVFSSFTFYPPLARKT